MHGVHRDHAGEGEHSHDVRLVDVTASLRIMPGRLRLAGSFRRRAREVGTRTNSTGRLKRLR